MRCGLRSRWCRCSSALAFAGPLLLHPFGLDPHVEQLALEYWMPRMGGAFLGSMAWAAMGFFNGISAMRFTMAVVVTTTVANAIANQFFIFELGMGMKGSAWATNFAQLVGVALAMALFLRGETGRRYRSKLMWRPRWSVIRAQLMVGLPIGVMYGADVLGLALSQMMIAQTSADRRRRDADRHGAHLDGLHAHDRHRARRHDARRPIDRRGQTASGRIAWATSSSRCARRSWRSSPSLLLVVGPVGVAAVREQRAGRRPATWWRSACMLLWPAAAYQIFDGLYCGASFCLRGAGDTRVPAATALVLSWFLFVPLAHTLIFAPGAGWIDGLPQFGLGAKGGWLALMSYVILLGCSMFWRWRHGAWRTSGSERWSDGHVAAEWDLPDRRARAGMPMIGAMTSVRYQESKRASRGSR